MMGNNTINRIITGTAAKYINVAEIKGNLGWKDKLFEKAMAAVGWYKGAHWCAFFMEKVWREAYSEYYKFEPEKHAKAMVLLGKLCSGNSQRTYRNFKASGVFTTGNEPVTGAAAIWKYTGISGHTAACIIEIDPVKKQFKSIEGNAGDKVAVRLHKFGEKNLLGFIYPKEF